MASLKISPERCSDEICIRNSRFRYGSMAKYRDGDKVRLASINDIARLFARSEPNMQPF
jgi:hypothetical protein